MKTIPQEFKDVRVVDLQYHPENPRQGDVGAIHTSIEANGFYGAIIVQKSTSIVLAGNHRLQAAAAAGAETVPVIEVDVDDETARRILLVDNRTNDVASYDEHALLEMLKSIGATDEELLGTGYDADDLDALARLAAAGAKPLDPNAEWDGMPPFRQDGIESIFSCIVHFATVEDADAFFAGIERPKAKSFWWPQDDGHKGSDLRQQDVAAE